MTNTQPNPDVTLAEYEYNGLNQKIKRESSGSSLDDVFYYFGAGNQLLEEEKVSGGVTLKCHVWGTQYIDDAVATANGSGTFTFLAHADQHNTVTEIDDAGSVLRRQLYHGFGLPTQVAANWLSYETITEDKSLFTGRLYHLDHAAYDFRNRFEDPEIAVFSQRDPIGIWGDGAAGGNGYAFLANDPVNVVDGNGLLSIKHRGMEIGYCGTGACMLTSSLTMSTGSMGGSFSVCLWCPVLSLVFHPLAVGRLSMNTGKLGRSIRKNLGLGPIPTTSFGSANRRRRPLGGETSEEKRSSSWTASWRRPMTARRHGDSERSPT